MPKGWVIVVIAAAVAIAGCSGSQGASGVRRILGGSGAAAEPDYEVVVVNRGNIASVVSATGTVLPEREASISFQLSGIVEDVLAQPGDSVRTGQLLAQLDTADLELAVRQADIALRQAQSQAQQLDEGPSASDVAAAEAGLASAQVAYEQLLKGSDKDQLAAARASVEQARVALEQAQQGYDKIKDVPGAGMLPQSQQLQQATINYETAQAQYRVTARGANQAQVAQAQAQIAQAQATLDKLKKGATKEQQEVAQAAVDQAQVALEQAQRRLANTRISAPWPGVLTAVNVVEGIVAQPGAPAFQLADLSRFHIDVQVDEMDIANVVEGQAVTIELDALPDQELTGSVARIAPIARTGSTTGTTYDVRIDLEPTSLPLRAGMSATATITSSARDNVLLVPNRAVHRDRDTGQTFVERLVGGTPGQVEIQLGLRDDQQSEVRAGLNEGDQIAIRDVSSLQKLQQTFSGLGQ
jgi:HlyD family secretion protein